MKTFYINTDLELVSRRKLTNLVSALEAAGMFVLYQSEEREKGKWRARLEWLGDWRRTTPEKTIRAMLAIVEGLDETSRCLWDGCTQRVFDIGYESGNERFTLIDQLSFEAIRRIAELGATIGWSIY